MNKTDTLLDSLQHQQAQIEDKEAFTDRVMGRIEGVEDYIPRHDCGTPLKRGRGRLTQQNNSQFSILNFQFAARVAASVALVLLVGLFVALRVQPVGSADLTVRNLHNIDRYRIDLSHISTDGTSRDMYRRYQEAKREQTFYHNELIKYSHENM